MGQEARYLAASSLLSLENSAAVAVRYAPWLIGAGALFWFFRKSR